MQRPYVSRKNNLSRTYRRKRDPEDIKEGIAETPEESKERLRRSDMTKGTDKA
jgi:hypothetical protein